MARLGQAFVNIGTKDQDLRTGLASARRTTEKEVAGIQSVLDTLSLPKLMGAAGIGVGVFGLVELGKDILNTSIQTQQLTNAFNAIGGSAKAGGANMDYIRTESKRLGLEIMGTTDAYKGLSAAAKDTALEGKPVREIFTSVTEAATVLGLRSEQTSLTLLALSQMISKGKVQSEELRRQLGEHLPGAFNLAAKAMGVTTAELEKMMEQGKVVATDFLPRFARVLHEQYSGSVGDAANSAQANINRFSNAATDLKNELAKGLLPLFTEAIQKLTGFVTALTDSEKRMKDLTKQSRELDTNHLGEMKVEVKVDKEKAQKDIDDFIRVNGIGQSFSALGKLHNFLKSNIGSTQSQNAWSMLINPMSSGIGSDVGGFQSVEADLYRALNPNTPHEMRMMGQSAGVSAALNQQLQQQKDIVSKITVPMENYRKELEAIDYVMRSTKEGTKAYNDLLVKREYVIKQMDKAGREKPALAFNDMDKQYLAVENKITDALQHVTKASADYQIFLADTSGDFVKSERIRWSQWAEDRKKDFSQVVATTEQAYIELKQRAEKAAADDRVGVDPQVLEMLETLRQKVEYLKNEIPEYTDLIDKHSKAQNNWADSLKALDQSSQLAQVNLQYAQLTGSLGQITEATKRAADAELQLKLAQLGTSEQTKELHQALEALNGEQKRLADLQANGSFFDGMKEGLRQVRNEQSAFKEGMDAMKKGIDDAAGALADFAMTGEMNFGNLLQSIARDILKSQIKKLLMDMLSPLMGGGGSGGFDLFGGIMKIFGSIGGMFGAGSPNPSMGQNGMAGRADGGSVFAGQSYIVGERGPEIFTPRSSGRIDPRPTAAGSNGKAPTVNVILNNNGQQLEASRQTVTRDSSGNMVIELMLDHAENNPTFRKRWSGAFSR